MSVGVVQLCKSCACLQELCSCVREISPAQLHVQSEWVVAFRI
jgi:hypothetical protein